MSIKTTFATLELRNPIIAASSGCTNSVSQNVALSEAGVGAIVLKSLFEENIIEQSRVMAESTSHTEADYLQGYIRSEELASYLKLISESKAQCNVPIIASINCVSSGEWSEFATLIEEAGADAIELNVMDLACSTEYADGDFEQRHVEISRAVMAAVKIPVIVKLCASITNPVAMASRLKGCGVAAVVMFNRMYQSDINIEKMEYTSANILSGAHDFALPLRWIGVASARVQGIDFAHSGGVQSGSDVVKAILAGASAVEVCSSLYREGGAWVAKAIAEVEKWQESKGFELVAEYKGKMNAEGSAEAEILVRQQFLRHFSAVKPNM